MSYIKKYCFVVSIFVITETALADETDPCERAPRMPIGVALMESDGTLVLTLRANGENGEIGDSVIEYKVEDPEYLNVKKHLGEIEPNQKVLVNPWCDE